MPGLNLNFGSSVLKREAKSIDRVDDRLVSAGWNRTDSALGGRVRYYEKAGFNITAMSGPMGTVIVPSGPIRGTLFGADQSVGVNQTSVIGAGQRNSSGTSGNKSGGGKQSDVSPDNIF